MKALEDSKTWNLVQLPKEKKIMNSLKDTRQDLWQRDIHKLMTSTIRRLSVTPQNFILFTISLVWFEAITSCTVGWFSIAMKKFGFKWSHLEHTLFLKHRNRKVTTLIVFFYVDDMIITRDDKEEMFILQKYLATEFKMKNLGLKYFLGIEVARSKKGIFLSRSKHVLELLSKMGMLDCKLVNTPIVHNYHLGEYLNHKSTNKERYQRNGFMFSKNNHLDNKGYTDANWAGSVIDRRFTLGCFTFVGGNLVTGRNKKQKVMALSSVEAEFRSITKRLCELL
ncbi:putative mitochondrial protein, partial [Mucuna pruriens]